jgi:transposase
MGQHPAKKQSQRTDLLQPLSLPHSTRVERFFNNIKQRRRPAMHYDKVAANDLAFVQLASISPWPRVSESKP